MLRAIAARLMSRLALERSAAFSLIQSRSSDWVSAEALGSGPAGGAADVKCGRARTTRAGLRRRAGGTVCPGLLVVASDGSELLWSVAVTVPVFAAVPIAKAPAAVGATS